MNGKSCDLQDIYEIYQPKVLRYITRLVGDEEAEDLTQEVFIKACHGLSGFRGDAKLTTWLYQIATNTAYDRLRSPFFRRSANIRPCHESTVDDAEDIGDCDLSTGVKTPPVEQQFVKKEMSECILSYIDKLPECYRTVLLLSDMEEFRDKEIAEILGLTLETVKIRLHRARARLREEFETHCEYYWVSELGWRAT